MQNKVTVVFERENFNKKVILNYALFIIGVKSEIVNDISEDGLENVMLYYGESRPANYKGIFIQKGTIATEDFNRVVYHSAPASKNIEIDILQLLEILINDTVNDQSVSNAFDDLDRLTYESSFQFKNKFAELPLVNIIISFLEKQIDAFYPLTKIPLWPDNKKCTIVLSHDVDEPVKHASFFNHKLFPERPAQTVKHYYHLFRLAVTFLVDKNKDDYWLFNEIVDFEKSLGFKSTFFFAVVDKWQAYAHSNDVNYKISNKRFLDAFKKIMDNGFEIGLHASFNAYMKAERFIEEKQTLEKIAQTNVLGLRHHYWHMAKKYRDTLVMHDNAGFQYDCSVAFNFNIGFRNNSALPYPLLHPQEEKCLNMIEIPTFCMDGHIFYKHDNVEKGFKEIAEAIANIKKYNGIGGMDWHVRTSFPKNKKYKNWGELYVKTLNHLASDKEIWVTSYKEVMEWLDKRKKELL